jgi:hypothetical protein
MTNKYLCRFATYFDTGFVIRFGFGKSMMPALLMFLFVTLNIQDALAVDSAADIDVTSAGAACDGITDDTAAIQKFIRNAAGHKMVYFPRDRTCLVRGIQVTSNSHLIIDGTIKLIADSNSTVLNVAAGVENVIIDGSGSIDGNREAQKYNDIAGFASINASNIRVSNISIKHVKNWPINIVHSKGCLLENLNINDGGNSVEFASGSTNCWARQLQISDISDEGFAFYGGVSNSGILDSTIRGSHASGISVLSDRSQTGPNHDIVISGNTVSKSTIAGIEVAVGRGGSRSYNVQISSNRLSQNGLGGNGFGGVRIVQSSYVQVNENVISEDGGNTNEATGIYIINSHHVDIVGNFIINEATGSSVGTGIHLRGYGEDVVVLNNTVVDDRPQPKMTHAIIADTPSDAHFALKVDENTSYGVRGLPYQIEGRLESVPSVSTGKGRHLFTTYLPLDRGSINISDSEFGLKLSNSDPINSFVGTLPRESTADSVFTLVCGGDIALLRVGSDPQHSIGASPQSCLHGDIIRWRFVNLTWKRM